MTTNIGYDVLVSCNQQLFADFASDPGRNAGVLFQNHLISDEINQKTNQLDKTNTDKARTLVSELQAKVKSFPETYDKFITILRERNERHDDLLLSVLTEKYKELEAVDQASPAVCRKRSHSTQSKSLSSVPSIELTGDADLPVVQNSSSNDEPPPVKKFRLRGQAGGELTHRSVSTTSSGIESLMASDFRDFSFQCGCGKCTILGYVTGRDKCGSSKPPQIKRCTPCSNNRLSPTEISYSKFKTALDEETTHIHSKFCSLLTDTISNLENQYDVTKVKQYVQALLQPRESYYRPLHRSPSEEILLRDITSFSELSDFLQNNFCSWFNYSLISVIREEFLFPYEDDQALQKYECSFRQCVNRRCFLYVDDFGPQPSHIQSVEITCKIDDVFETITYDQIQRLELVLMKCWEQIIPRQVLNLKYVRDGCIELVFRVPAYFRHVHDQLSLEQMQHLRENAFTEVKIGQQVLLKAEANSTNTHEVSQPDEHTHRTSSDLDALPMSPSAVQSRAERHDCTIRSRNFRGDDSEPSPIYTPLPESDDETTEHSDSGYNESYSAVYVT